MTLDPSRMMAGVRIPTRWPSTTFLLGGFFLLLGVFMALLGQMLGIGLVLLGALVILVVERPVWTLAFVVMAQVLIPIYAVYTAGFLPHIPLALFPLLVLSSITLLDVLLDRRPRMSGVLGRRLSLSVFFYVVALMVSLVDEGSNKDSVMLWIRAGLIPFVLFLTAVRVQGGARDVALVFQGLLFAAVGASLYAVVEMTTGRNILIEQLIMNTGTGIEETMSLFYARADTLRTIDHSLMYRCFSLFISPIEFGTFMGMVYPYPLIHSLTASSNKARLLYGSAALLCVVGVVLSASRGPILSLVMTTIVLSILLKPLQRVMIIALVICTIGTTAVWPWVGDMFSKRLTDADNITVRLKLWRVGVHAFLDNPILGVGLGNYPNYQSAFVRKYEIGPFFEEDIDITKTVDNAYIQLAAETGIVGLAAFSGVIAVFYALIFRLLRHAPSARERHLAMATGAGVFSYLSNGLTMNAVVFFPITLMFAVFLALAVALERGTNASIHESALRAHSPQHAAG